MVLGTLEVFVRSTHVNLARPRWIELSFTREESIQATNKVSLNFGASQDTRGVNMVDSIQVWTRTKEAFGWPEDCVSSPEELDVEQFHHLVATARAIAVARYSTVLYYSILLPWPGTILYCTVLYYYIILSPWPGTLLYSTITVSRYCTVLYYRRDQAG